MKTLKFLMVLLFSSVIFVSCVGGVDADIERYCEIECQVGDMEDGDEKTKLVDEWKALAEKYEGEESEASEEDQKAWKDKKACECDEKKDDK